MDDNNKPSSPLIFETPSPAVNKDAPSKGRFIQAILPILIIVIVIELVLGAKTLLSPIPASGKIQGYKPAEISLISNKQSFKVGDDVAVAVRISTGGHSTVGTDLSLKYDPNILDASSPASFIRGQIYKDYPIISIDNSAGVVKISGIDSPGQSGFSGIGVMGELLFKAKKDGHTSVTIDYKKGDTTKTNIIEEKTANNIIETVYNLDLTINAADNPLGGSSSTKAPTCSPRVLTVCTDSQGRVGSNWCTSIKDPLTCQIGCFKERTGDEEGCRGSYQQAFSINK